jgi:CSLREA domain-containing protein
MNTKTLSLAIGCIFCVFATFAAASAQNFGQLFIVDTVADSHDGAPGDSNCADISGRCSLRAAIEEANITPSTRDAVIFSLPNPSVIDLTIGELTVSGKIAIVGPGARRLTVQRSAGSVSHFRIFRVAAGASGTILRNLKVRNGLSDDSGGGIMIEAGSVVTASDLWLNGNHAGGGGGIANAGNLTIVRSLIDSNDANIFGADNLGGGIANLNAQTTLKIINSTITGNTGARSGAIDNAGSVTLINSTVARNFASDACSTMCNAAAGTVTVLNTLIGSDSQSAIRSALSGTFTSLGNNIVTDARGTTGFTNGVNGDQVSDSNAIDPMIGTLSNNGGETDTLPLMSGSPAVDHGNACVSIGNCSGLQVFVRTDQRSGYFRGFLAPIDVGAFELNAPNGASFFSIGTFAVNQPAIFGGVISVATNAVTLEKVYSVMNPFGRNRLPNLSSGVWILERRAKRAAAGMDPQVMSSEDFPPISLAGPLALTRPYLREP